MSGCGAVIENILLSNNTIIEGRKIPKRRSPKSRLKCVMNADRTFARIWHGVEPRGISLKSLITEDLKHPGEFLWLGRRWSQYPHRDRDHPAYLSLQGREAKEAFDPFNDYPTEIIIIDGRKIRVLQYCDACGGDLQKDHNMNLYCVRCMLIQE